MTNEDLVYRLRKRAEIRRQAKGRRSVEEGKPDRISDLLEEAAREIEIMRMRDSSCYDPLDGPMIKMFRDD